MAYVKNGFLITIEANSKIEVLISLNKITYISSSRREKDNFTRINFGETAETYMYVDSSEPYEEIKRVLGLNEETEEEKLYRAMIISDAWKYLESNHIESENDKD